MVLVSLRSDYAFQTLTDAATVAWDASQGQVAQVTLGGDRTLGTPTGIITGQAYQLVVVQGAGGNHTLTLPSTFVFPGGASPSWSTTAGERDILSFVYDGSRFLSQIHSGYPAP